MTSRPNSTKLAAVVSAAVFALVCAAYAMTAGSQVVDHDKVVEDPQLDYRKYSKEIAAALAPKRDEAELAQTLRALSPSATPNPRLIAVADALLERNGRMIEAIQSIGRGADAFEGTPFELKIMG